jgi:uncharacterized YigZ family protein
MDFYMRRYIIPARETSAEIFIQKSRFIATIGPAFSIDEAKDFISCVKNKFRDASHHVPAYLIGHGSRTIAYCSDAGEPSGTAGRPTLAILQGSGVGDVVVVVTRYFGGIKLGTGGLVHAYTDAVKEVLAILPRARKVTTHTILLVVSYPYYDHVRKLIEMKESHILETEFGREVKIIAQVDVDTLFSFNEALTELTHGRVQAIILDTKNDTIMPLGSQKSKS